METQAQSAAGARGRHDGRPRLARILESLMAVREGEARDVFWLSAYAFLLLVAYYILRTVREPLLLGSSSAEMKSYAGAVGALVLLILVPLYGSAFRRTNRARLVRGVTWVFIATLGFLCLGARARLDVGFVYYVWVSIFGVTIVAQFWAHAADVLDVDSGERLFPLIMAGAALGGLVGPCVARVLYGTLGPASLMLLALVLIAATLPLVELTRGSVVHSPREAHTPRDRPASHLLGGFTLILRDSYLLLLALLVLLLNVVSSMGDFLLADGVVGYADARVAHDPSVHRELVIARLYGDFYLAVNVLTVIAQLALVGRVFRSIGVHGALLLLPVVAVVGYGLAALVPVFAILWTVMLVQHSGNYSLMNTARHALYLPLPAADKYEGKLATDTFFWRCGDLLPAAFVYVGGRWLEFEFREFALLNVALSAVWVGVALQLARRRAEGGQRGKRARRALSVSVLGGAAGLLPAMVRSTSRAAVWIPALLGVLAMTASAPGDAKPAEVAGEKDAALFERTEPLALELEFDHGALCRSEARCADVPATLLYRDAQGREQRAAAAVRVRGRYRADRGHCTMPPLFMAFTGDTRGTPFEGERLLPLTTHCRHSPAHEQYVLKEYLAYRIYNLLTPKSLRVRLVRATYRDTSGRAEPVTRYAFFTEHFESLARREASELWTPDRFDVLEANAMQIATLDVFQYLIGNTDWSAVYRHNVVLIRGAAGDVVAVPYDFDFSGLVNARYAAVAPELPIRSVRERLFRGICRPDTDWYSLANAIAARRAGVLALADEIEGLAAEERAAARRYLEEGFAVVMTPLRREVEIVGACRHARR